MFLSNFLVLYSTDLFENVSLMEEVFEVTAIIILLMSKHIMLRFKVWA